MVITTTVKRHNIRKTSWPSLHAAVHLFTCGCFVARNTHTQDKVTVYYDALLLNYERRQKQQNLWTTESLFGLFFLFTQKTHTETNKYVNIIRKNEYFRNSSSRHHLNTFVILSWKCVYAHVFPVIQGTIIFSLVGKITADLSIKYELSHIQCNKSFIHY